MFRALLFLTVCQAIVTTGFQTEIGPSYRSSGAIANTIRNLTKSWTAGANPLPISYYRGGVRLEYQDKFRLPMGIPVVPEVVTELPESFDARDQWPECSSIGEIRQQGCCGSCWAVAATSVMTDRWCIHSPERSQFTFGAYDLLSCCRQCGEGCQGGNTGPAWAYWVEWGLSSGGPYNSRSGCHPYPIDVCHSSTEENVAPLCSLKCHMSYNVTDTSRDRRYGKVAYSVAADEERIKEEIYLNGPVQAVFRVYVDFKAYKSGVYRHVWGPKSSNHAVKMLGWGVENGVKYWLCANSWGESWGDAGFFKIVRGENHLGIESDVHAGLPNFKKHEEA
ncbi:cathepsin B-like [Toxorhynchites rutilus septentrionalis]|uniref:cathepsin B-like n=1 Tax=Toxorhynchites rutilus septentrionalis TaxID=329112 RepID=UPI00247A343D|nr:cathepsin B-like [Toxorhynchites rutilus septentrionalis]